MSLIINKIKANIDKIIDYRKEYAELKDLEYNVTKTLFFSSVVILSFVLMYFLSNEIILEDVNLYSLIVVCLLTLIPISAISMFITGIGIGAIKKFYARKEIKKIKKIFNLPCFNREIYSKKSLKKVIQKRNDIDSDLDIFESIYFSEEFKDSELAIKMIIDFFINEKELSVEKYCDYVEQIKICFTNKDCSFFFRETIYFLINKISRKEFFDNKNKLIDLIYNSDYIVFEDKDLFINSIKAKVDSYNFRDLENENLKKKTLILKESIDYQEEITIKKEKKLIIKSI
jgi:hypothetical protein